MDKYFSEDILASLLPEVKQGVDDLFAEKQKLEGDLASATTKLEDSELQFEQRYYELEKEMLKAKEDLQLETKKSEELAKEIKTHNDEGLVTKKEVLKLRQDHKEANAAVETLQSKLSCLASEKQDLNQILESRSQEIEYLSEETKKLRSNLMKAETARIEAEANYEKFVSTQENHGFEVGQLKHQIELLNMQIEKQSDDIMSKHEEIQRLRREKIFAASDVQKKLDKLTEEHSVLKSKLDDSTKLNKQYEGQVARYIDKLRDADEFNAGLESHFQKEIENQTKLAELYGKANEEAESKNKNLLNAVAELQRMVFEANEARDKAEESREKINSEFESLKEDFEKEVERLTVELERANELINMSKKSKELIEMSPSAEAISKQMKAGLTFTDMYSKYVDATQQFDIQKAENMRLQKAIEQIVGEIEEKAPVLRQQKEDYENSLVSISELTQKLDLALVQSQKAKFTIESLQRANDFMKRQNAALEQTKQDLCKQLQHLMQEIALLKGANFVDDRNTVPDPSAIDDETFANDSDKVISMNLVKYSDIIDLQVKNTQLLAALRCITDEKEAEHQDKYRTKLENLEMKLKAALEDNERYKDEMSTMKELMTRTEKQKEMYKVLFEQEEAMDGTRSGDKTSTVNDSSSGTETASQNNTIATSAEVSSKSPTKSSNVSFSGAAFAQSGMHDEERRMLQDAIQQLKEEVKEWKEEAKNAEIKANERCCEYSKENSDLRLQNSKALSEAQNLSEKVKLQELNESVLQKELEQYRKQVNAMSATQAKMQSNIDILSTEVRSAQEKYSSAYARLQSLQSEKELLKNTEKHLVRERDRLLEDKKVQSTLMANIDSLKNSLELNSNEQKLRYQKTICTLQSNLDVAQKRIREMETERRTTVKTYEDKLKELNEKLSNETNRYLVLNTEMVQLKNDNATLQAQLQQSTSDGSAFKWASGASQSPISPATKSPSKKDLTMDSTDVEDLRDVLLKLERANNEVSILTNQKAALEKHIENYKEMCKVSEQKYNSDTVHLNEKIHSLEKQLRDQSNAQKNQFQTMAKLENDNNRLRDDLKTMIDNSDSSHSKIVKKCDDLENQLSQSLGTNKALKCEIDNLKSQLSDKTQSLALLSEKLETSSQKLSDGSSQVAAAESQLLEKNKEVDKMTIQVNSLNQEIDNLKALIQNNLDSYKTKEDDWRKRLDDVDSQNKILLEEIDKLGALLNKAKESCLNQSLNDSLVQGSLENPPPGTENLIEVIRHLRREKDICLAKYEVNQGECERARQKLEFTQKRVTELEAMLKEEEERHQKTYQALSQQEELQKKMDQILVLQDSNAYLRKENAQLLSDLKAEKHRQKRAEEAALKPLQDEIATLQLNAEAHSSEVQIMTDEIAKWKARNNELLERITKIDAEEHKKVLVRVKELEAKNVGLSAELKTTESKMFNINKEKNDYAEKYRASSTESNLLRTAKNALETEKASLAKQNETLKAKMEEMEKENKILKVSAEKVTSLQTRYKNLQVYAKTQLESVKKLTEENETLKTQMTARTKEVADLSQAKLALEQRVKQASSGESSSAVANVDNKDVLLQSENLELRSRCETLESELKKLKLSLDETQKRSSLLETTLSNRGLDLASSGNDVRTKSLQLQIDNLQKKNKAFEEDIEKMATMKKKYLEIINALKKRCTDNKEDISRLEKEKTDLGTEVNKNKEESKKNLEDRDKFRELCLQYENKIESLESKVEALEMAAKTKPREVRLLNDDQPSTSQPKLAVSGQQRTDSSSKGSGDRPSANIKPQPQRTPQATIRPTPQPVAPQTTVVHVQPMQSVQSSGNDTSSAIDQIPQPSTSVPTGSVFGIANPQNSARVAPQVRTVGEISSVQTPPHAQEFAIHTSAASSTTIDIITTTADNSGMVQNTDGATASTTSALVLPLTSRTPINLPISNSERGGDTTAAIQPYNLHPSYGGNLGSTAPYLNVTTPIAQVSPDQQQQEISSSSAQQSQISAPLIGPYSTSGRPATSFGVNRGESGPADSSFASTAKRNRDSLTSSDEEHSGGKRARVLPTSSADDNVSRPMTSSTSQHRLATEESNEVDPVIIPSGAYNDSVASSSAANMVLPEIPIAVYDAIAAISSSASDLSSVTSAEVLSQHTRSVSQNDNEADAFQVDFRGSSAEDYEGGSQNIQTIGVAADSNTCTSIEPSVIESGQYEEIEETIGTTDDTNDDDECEVGEISAREEYEGEEMGYMDDTNEQDEDGESDDEDNDEDDVICLSGGENDAEPQFASLEPHDSLLQNEDNQQEINELEQDEFNAYVEEPMQSSSTIGGHVEVIGSDFPAEHSSEGGFIVSTEQPFVVAQSETYNIEAMESSSGQPASGMHANNDNLVWTKSPDRVQNVGNLEVDTSEPPSPASDTLALRSVTPGDSNDAAVTSSGTVVEPETSETPQLRSIENVARKSTRPSRPRLRRNPTSNTHGSGGNGADDASNP